MSLHVVFVKTLKLENVISVVVLIRIGTWKYETDGKKMKKFIIDNSYVHFVQGLFLIFYLSEDLIIWKQIMWFSLTVL